MTFLYSSTPPEIRAAHMLELLQVYFYTVSNSLMKLGINLEKEGYSFESFYEDYRELCWKGMITGLVGIAAISNKGLASDVEEKKENLKNQGMRFFYERLEL